VITGGGAIGISSDLSPGVTRVFERLFSANRPVPFSLSLRAHSQSGFAAARLEVRDVRQIRQRSQVKSSSSGLASTLAMKMAVRAVTAIPSAR